MICFGLSYSFLLYSVIHPKKINYIFYIVGKRKS